MRGKITLAGELVGPEHLRQVFNDTHKKVLWIIGGATRAIRLAASHPE
jgi:hypothetical protein